MGREGSTCYAADVKLRNMSRKCFGEYLISVIGMKMSMQRHAEANLRLGVGVGPKGESGEWMNAAEMHFLVGGAFG